MLLSLLNKLKTLPGRTIQGLKGGWSMDSIYIADQVQSGYIEKPNIVLVDALSFGSAFFEACDTSYRRLRQSKPRQEKAVYNEVFIALSLVAPVLRRRSISH